MITAPMTSEQARTKPESQKTSPSFRTHEQGENMLLHITETGEGRAFMVASALKDNNAALAAHASYARIGEVLHDNGMTIVHERIFGSLSNEAEVIAARGEALSARHIPATGPITYIQGSSPFGNGLAGIIIQAVSSGTVRTIMDGTIPCGRVWKINGSTFLVLQNIQGTVFPSLDGRGDGEGVTKSHQARRMFERAERMLREQGFSYRDVVRTWFYLSTISSWYAEFNKVRNEKYGEFGIMPGPQDRSLLLPASTGISGDTLSGAAATMDLIAVAGDRSSRPAVKQLTSTAQLDAFRYGSAFSRGALIQEPDVSLLEVSGTAAIDQRGKSQFPDDIRGQITCTFDKIEKLMNTQGAGLKDIAAATVFVKRPEYAGIFWEMARDRGLEEFPALCVVADVCRDELLFEIDAEATVGKKGSRIQGFEGHTNL